MFIIAPFIASLLITFFATPLVIRFAKAHSLVDDPKIRHHPAQVHTGIIPRAGGLALFFGVSIPIAYFLGPSIITVAVILSLLMLTIIGLLDDRKDVPPIIRLFTNALAATTVIAAGIRIDYVTNPFSPEVLRLDEMTVSLFGFPLPVWSILFAFIWILWTTNIVGWSAGVDGQMPGFTAIAATTIGLLSLRFFRTDPSQTSAAIFSFIVAGAFMGFLPWNVYPQRIMPGYGGKTIAGFLLALIGIFSYAKVGTALLVLGVPVLDAVYTLIRRVSSGKSPVLADRGHFHHELLKIGWSKRKIALFYWGVSAILGAVALSVPSTEKVYAFILVGVLFGGFILWVKYFMLLQKQQDRDNG